MLLGVLITTLNSAQYIYSILKKGVRPHFYSWLIWTLVTGIAAAGQFSAEGGIGAIVMGWMTITLGARAIVAFLYGEKNIAYSDRLSLFFCLTAIIIWQITDNALYAVIIAATIDAVAIYPTVRKSFNAPHQENIMHFLLGNLTVSCSLIALESYNPTTIIYPITIIITNFAVALYLLIRRKQIGQIA